MKLSKSDMQKLKQYFARQKDVLAVYLYGSFAKETTHKRSDIDFGVLFDGKVDLYQRLGRLNSELYNLKLPAEPEVREVDLQQSPVYLRNVVQGKLIYSRDEIKRIRFEVTVMRTFRDNEYFRQLKNHYMKQRLKEGTYGFRQNYII